MFIHLPVCVFAHLSVCLSFLSIYLLIYLFIFSLSAYVYSYLRMHLLFISSMFLPVSLLMSIYLSFCLFIYPSIYFSPTLYQFTCLAFYSLPIYLFIDTLNFLSFACIILFCLVLLPFICCHASIKLPVKLSGKGVTGRCSSPDSQRLTVACACNRWRCGYLVSFLLSADRPLWSNSSPVTFFSFLRCGLFLCCVFCS